MKKQKTLRKHKIAWVEYTIVPKSRIQIGEGIPINNIILLMLFEKAFPNIVVCTRFDTNTTSVPRR